MPGELRARGDVDDPNLIVKIQRNLDTILATILNKPRLLRNQSTTWKRKVSSLKSKWQRMIEECLTRLGFMVFWKAETIWDA